MIFKAVLLVGLVTVAYSINSKGLASLSSQNRPTYARILSQAQDTNPDGSYHYSFETENGINQQQSGEPRQIGKEIGIVAQGSASWTDSEGNGHQLNYVADENGYQPQSPDIPVPPAVPELIGRALEWIRSHPEKPKKQL
ncbi:larval cuticle protein LCP-22-like [Sitophilus oryzae]|uniref:Larval cuticle protein LCP-22-like n=1 Tax=Sitophilus oryzae TaxID=7048 RepID=A0A6J2Y315_SITOR|nr:larval cuticle protein LCP-22-like [Sitophilus oryzae]